MALRQALNSIQRIIDNPHVRSVPALGRYVAWQGRRIANWFPAEIRISSSVLVSRSRDCGVSSLVNTHGLYDYNNMMLIKLLLGGGGGFVDVGANIGAFTLIAAEQAAARVLAIEPHPGTFDALERNVGRNEYANVTLVRSAAGDAEGEVTITDTPGSSTTHITAAGAGLAVPLHRLDGLLARHGVSPDIVKIDVEGFELGVLRGLGTRLQDVKTLFVEINGLGEERSTATADLLALLASAGLVGPLYCDFNARSLCRKPVHVGEDPVFVQRAFRSALSEQFGFTVAC